jgi:hypothetical protein
MALISRIARQSMLQKNNPAAEPTGLSGAAGEDGTPRS